MAFCEQHGYAGPCPRCTKNSRKANAELARLRAECERLRLALRPFAESPLNDLRYERYIVSDPPLSTAGVKREDFFRATAALKETPCPK